MPHRVLLAEADKLIPMHDITKYKQVEENLRKALTEKDVLMSELNHRVKNKLPMVSSLISFKDSENKQYILTLSNTGNPFPEGCWLYLFLWRNN